MNLKDSIDSKETEILYLGMYDSSPVMKMICDLDPVLLYFACYRAKLVKTSPLFDHQEDCKMLKKMGIVKYINPRNRSSHFVKETDCVIVKGSKQLIEDIKQINLHRILQKIDRESKTREDFRVAFKNKISFEKNPEDILEKLIIRVNGKHNLDWNFHGSKGEKDGVIWFVEFTTPDNEELHYSINVKCKCKNKIREDFTYNEEKFELWKGYSLICSNCKREYQISFNFRYIKIIEIQ